MNWFSKLIVFAMILICGFWIKDTFFPNADLKLPEKFNKIKPDVFDDEIPLSEEGKRILGDKEEKEKIENTVKIYFLKLNSDGISEIYISKRELKDINLNNVIKLLLKGPNSEERNMGVYSEIPNGTKLLSVMESDDKIIINLNSDFQYGGGTDSVNNRLRQLIKTVVNISPDKNIYLYLDGKQADVLGGDGVIITQPINTSDFNF